MASHADDRRAHDACGGAVMSMVNGREMHREVSNYIGRTGTSWETLAIAAGVGTATVRQLNTRSYVLPATAARLRAVMKAHPAGVERHTACLIAPSGPVPSPMQPVVDPGEVARLEAVRPVRSVPMSPFEMLSAPTVGEAIASGLVETPADLIAIVQRRWPAVWARVVERARATDILPGALLVEAIERGLEAA